MLKLVGALASLTILYHIHIRVESKVKKQIRFEDIAEKFEPRYLYEQMDRKRSMRRNQVAPGFPVTGIPKPTATSTVSIPDFTLPRTTPNIPVKNGNDSYKPNWMPPFGVQGGQDPFSVRRRLIELMKQAIYQTRNKMVMMQIFRKKYQKSPLYKMGFLISRTDTNCKIFSQFSFRAIRMCLLRRQEVISKVHLYEMMQANERQLQHWFNIELLVDLIKRNDERCKMTLKRNMTDRKRAWKFID